MLLRQIGYLITFNGAYNNTVSQFVPTQIKKALEVWYRQLALSIKNTLALTSNRSNIMNQLTKMYYISYVFTI